MNSGLVEQDAVLLVVIGWFPVAFLLGSLVRGEHYTSFEFSVVLPIWIFNQWDDLEKYMILQV